MWIVILGLISAIYLILNILIPGSSMVESYLIRPALWLTLAILTFLIARYEGLNIISFKKVRRWNLGRSPVHAAILLGGFYLSVLIIVGILFGFGKSPFSFTPSYILLNIFLFVSLILGFELSRAYLIKKFTFKKKKYFTLSLILITLLYVFIRISPGQILSLNPENFELVLEFIASIIITSIALNLLACYLSYLGGAVASISYMGIVLGFEWFSPILPNPHWMVLALVGTLAPAIGYIILQDSIQVFRRENRRAKHRRKASGHGWTIVAIFSVIIIFFSYGYLGVQPTVIYSGSMKPQYQIGDMVIIDEVNPDNIREGDIIQFVRNDVLIIHRVVDISYEDGEQYFITKGDYNEEADSDPVHPEQVVGKAVFEIPKIGWVQIVVKDFFKKVTNAFS